FLEFVGNGPEIGGAPAKTARIEIRRTLAEPAAGWREAAMRKAVHGNGVAKPFLRILIQHAQKTVQLLVSQFLQLFGCLVELAISAFFEALDPLRVRAGLRAAPKRIGKSFGDESLDAAQGLRDRIFSGFALSRRKIVQRFGADFLRSIAKDIAHGWGAGES